MEFVYTHSNIYQNNKYLSYFEKYHAISNFDDSKLPEYYDSTNLLFFNLVDSTFRVSYNVSPKDVERIFNDSSIIWSEFFDKSETLHNVAGTTAYKIGFRKVIFPQIMTSLSKQSYFSASNPHKIDTTRGIWMFAFNTDSGFQVNEGTSINVYFDLSSIWRNSNKIRFSYLLEFIDDKRPISWQQAIVEENNGKHYTKGVADCFFQSGKDENIKYPNLQTAFSKQLVWYKNAHSYYKSYFELYHTSKQLTLEELKPNQNLQDFILVKLAHEIRQRLRVLDDLGETKK